jgi:hypothetical protein
MVCNQLPESSYKTRVCASKVECQLEDCNMMMIRLITSPDSMIRWSTHKWRSPSFHCFVIKDDAVPPNLTPWWRPEWKNVVINPGQNLQDENYQWKNHTVSVCACLIVMVRWVWCGEPPVYIAEYLAVFHIFYIVQWVSNLCPVWHDFTKIWQFLCRQGVSKWPCIYERESRE